MPSAPQARVEVGVHRSIVEIAQADWDACFPGDPEGWASYRAIEAGGLAGFSPVYFAAREAGRIVAVVPAFITAYRLDTTIQGRLRTILRPLLRLARGLLTHRLACLGSPHADRCHLGFAPAVPKSRHAALTRHLLDALETFAGAEGIGLVAAKDIADTDLDHGVGTAFLAAGFARQPGLPNAVLSLPAAGTEAYLASLSATMRREVRRKLKSRALVRIETRCGPAALDLVAQIMQLYEEQRARSKVDFDLFETLSPAYFRALFEGPGSTAVVFAYFQGTELVAFNLCLVTGRAFIDKYIGFSARHARRLNLYVLSWMHNLGYCMAHSIPILQSGQTAYAMKLRLGSSLLRNWLYFRHRNRILDRLLRLAGPLLAADRHDPDLAGARRDKRDKSNKP